MCSFFLHFSESSTCWKYLSQLMYSLSWESCSLLVFTYCHRAWMMQERVWVWIPSRRARRGSSLNCGGCKHTHTHTTLNNATSHQLNQKSWTVPLKPLHVCFNAMLNLQFVTNPNFGQKSFYPHNVLTAVALCRPHLVVQHQQQSAANAHISRPFHLEAVGLLCGRCAVPLKNTKQPFKLM